jgi:hypothetical protein
MVLGVVARRELQDGLPGPLGQPHRRPLRQFGRPGDAAEHPRGLDAGQLGRGREVQVRGGVGVALQEGGGYVLGDLTLHGAGDDGRLVLPSREQGDLAGLEDSRDAHGDRLARHVVLAEEIRGRILAGHGVEEYRAGPRVLGRTRLVEADVAALADPEELEVDPAGRGDGPLVGGALLG